MVWKRFSDGVPKGSRTPVAAVKGRSPRPLDDGDYRYFILLFLDYFVNMFLEIIKLDQSFYKEETH